jgi:hypothetical protein
MPIVAVLDTNVWVSAFLNPVGHPARLIAAGKARQFELITSRPLLEELYDVLCRPRIMKIRGTSANDGLASRNRGRANDRWISCDVGRAGGRMRVRIDMKNPVREYRPPGSVRGAPGNQRPHLDKDQSTVNFQRTTRSFQRSTNTQQGPRSLYDGIAQMEGSASCRISEPRYTHSPPSHSAPSALPTSRKAYRSG